MPEGDRAASLRLVMTCALGLEPLLQEELEELGLGGLGRERGAVVARGSWRDVWRANLWLRTANRVLVELGSWSCRDDEALARGAGAIVRSDETWVGVGAAELFAPWRTLAVQASTSHEQLRDTRWAAVRTKDGIVDAQRHRFGSRSSVRRRGADLPLRVRIDRQRATLLLDTSREPLDRRHYRVESVGAPLREQLAAACVLASGWRGGGRLVDPMCGTGTLLVEGAWIAARTPPGGLRRRWVFEGLPGFDRAAWEELRQQATAAARSVVPLYGRDSDPAALRAARKSLARAGVAEHATLERGDAFALGPQEPPGLVVVNPPYGERLESDRELWRRLGDLLKRSFTGWTAVVLAGDPGRGKWIGLRPRRKIPVRNGPIDARILVFDLY